MDRIFTDKYRSIRASSKVSSIGMLNDFMLLESRLLRSRFLGLLADGLSSLSWARFSERRDRRNGCCLVDIIWIINTYSDHLKMDAVSAHSGHACWIAVGWRTLKLLGLDSNKRYARYLQAWYFLTEEAWQWEYHNENKFLIFRLKWIIKNGQSYSRSRPHKRDRHPSHLLLCNDASQHHSTSPRTRDDCHLHSIERTYASWFDTKPDLIWWLHLKSRQDNYA